MTFCDSIVVPLPPPQASRRRRRDTLRLQALKLAGKEHSRSARAGILPRWIGEVTPSASGRGLSPELRFVNMPIAIVGTSGVMPQSEDLDEFWENLKNSRDLITVIPPDRWRWEDYYGDPLKEANKSNSKWGGFMKEVDKFDPLFFGISPREAEMMDPQQRIFLEHVWKAIEDSGHKVSDLAGTRTGVFVGVATNDYVEHDEWPRHRAGRVFGLGKLPLASWPIGFHSCSICADPARPSTRPVPARWSPCTGPSNRSTREAATWRSWEACRSCSARPPTFRSAWPEC